VAGVEVPISFPAGRQVGMPEFEQPMHVLITDDDQSFRNFIRHMLESQSDLTVVGEALDGGEAVQKTGKLKPEVVLMDIDMPGIDGLEATRQVKASQPKTVVIMFSALDGTAYREAAARSGADDFLPKTASMFKILSTIRNWRRR
jgi:DNA-binding NarL/FixJ family response regulator